MNTNVINFDLGVHVEWKKKKKKKWKGCLSYS